jgi:hypothetical protein
MPSGEIMSKFYHDQPMSNGKKIVSLAQAKAIASQYGSEGDEKKKKKKPVSSGELTRLGGTRRK